MLARYGGSIAQRQRRDAAHSANQVPRFGGAHQFKVPGDAGKMCTLEVLVGGVLMPVKVRRLRFSPPIRPADR